MNNYNSHYYQYPHHQQQQPSQRELQKQWERYYEEVERRKQHEEAQRRQQQQQQEEQGDDDKWPPSLLQMAETSFNNTIDARERTEVEEELQNMVAEAIMKGDMYTRDWSKHTTPLDIVREKKRKLLEESLRKETVATSSSSGNNEGKSWGQFGGTAHSPASSSNKYEYTVPKYEAKREDTKKNKKKKKRPRVDLSFGSAVTDVEAEARNRRKARFQASKATSPVSSYNPYAASQQGKLVATAMKRAENLGIDLDLSSFAVKGTCTDLEKKYLRLTGVPDPALVRPEPVLHKSLTMVTNRWARSSQNKNATNETREKPGVTYLWTCEQFKSIRQDLTVQHIKNKFTVRVYETHARLALKEADFKEFNQCLTQLQDLFLIKGLADRKLRREFAAYKTLYLLYIRLKYNQSSIDLINLVSSMPEKLRKGSVDHALRIRSAVERGMYVDFFKLYDTSEKMGKYLLEPLLDYVRYGALRAMCKTFKPTLPVKTIRSRLRMEDNTVWATFLKQNPHITLVKTQDEQVVDTKASLPGFSSKYPWPVQDGDSVQHN